MVDHREEYDLCRRAADRLAAQGMGDAVAAVQLGSGIQTPELEGRRTLTFEELGLPTATAPGHTGAIHHGRLGDVPLLVLAGRLHGYEGHEPAHVVRPIRVVGLLGVPHLILTNASGGVREGWGAGTIVRITDHVNLSGRDPLTGIHDPRFGDRFVVTAGRAHDATLGALAHEIAAALGTELVDGVYGGVHGPSFETPAEVRRLRMIGVDCVGMSTVPEVLAATQVGLKTLVLSFVANPAGEVMSDMTAEEEVLHVARTRGDRLRKLVEGIVQALPPAEASR